jgi:hypothetical protein
VSRDRPGIERDRRALPGLARPRVWPGSVYGWQTYPTVGNPMGVGLGQPTASAAWLREAAITYG